MCAVCCSVLCSAVRQQSRFSYDGLKRQRLDAPLLKQGDSFVPVSWSAALLTIRDRVAGLQPRELLGVVGEQADCEAIIALKDWLKGLGSAQCITTQHPLTFATHSRPSYLFNSTIAGIDYADAVLLLNCNPRMEAPVLGARLRKAVRQFGQQILSVGPRMELHIPHSHIGDSFQALKQFTRSLKSYRERDSRSSDDVDGDEQAGAVEMFRKAKQPMVIVGMGSFREASTGAAVLAALEELKAALPALSTASWNGVNFLHTNASAVGALDLGVGNSGVQLQRGTAKFVFLLGADGVESLAKDYFAEDAFVVYAGSHGDVGASLADLVLPSPAYTEKSSTYVNMEGRVQRTKAAVGRLAEAREDWQTIRAVSELTGEALPYHSLEQIRERLVQVAPTFATLEQIHDKEEPHSQRTPSAMDDSSKSRTLSSSSSSSSPSSSTSSTSSVFVGSVSNYFFTDPISRSSATMAKCSAQLPNSRNSYIQQPQQQPQARYTGREHSNQRSKQAALA